VILPTTWSASVTRPCALTELPEALRMSGRSSSEQRAAYLELFGLAFVDFGGHAGIHDQHDPRGCSVEVEERAVILLCPRCGTPLRDRFLGEWFETNPQCQDCGVALGEARPMLAPSSDDVEYALGDWPAVDRAVVTDVLAGKGIRYRWIPGPQPVLAVPAPAEEEVDVLLDGFDDAGAVDDNP
jgi:predicted RNA-binding Zn-ribbon protein involved in translation (DUF1610 family)